MEVEPFQWSGDDWQEHILMLLKRHYPIGQFQEIPDAYLGDAGLEGFSNDGCAYQCYAPEEPLSKDARLESHKRKIRKDIKKFRDNRDLLVKLLGLVKIKAWVLAVPVFDNKELIAYGETKAAEIRGSSLPYVDRNFCIRIITADHFSVERQELLRVGLSKLNVEVAPPAKAELDKWFKGNPDFVRVLNGKLGRMKPEANASRLAIFRNEMVKHFVTGQNALQVLRGTHGDELYERIIRLKANQERYLAAASLAQTGVPSQVLKDTFSEYEKALMEKVVGMDGQTAKMLVWEAIADWLLRCPLDFEEVA